MPLWHGYPGDPIFESTSPPGGRRYEGRAQVRAAWAAFFSQSPQASFQTEECFNDGARAVVRWTYRWSSQGHVRGVDVFRLRDGRIAEKLSYVKG